MYKVIRHGSDYQLKDRRLGPVVDDTLITPERKKEDGQFKVTFSNITSWRPAWATRDHLKKVKTKQKVPTFKKGQGITPFLPLTPDAFYVCSSIV